MRTVNIDKKMLGYLTAAYYGGRTEVRVRHKPVRVAVLDFTSMYPTTYCLYNMDRVLKANKIICHECTEEAQRLLLTIQPEDIAKKESWLNWLVICKIKPDGDILPVRGRYGEDGTYTIGVNPVTSNGPSLWYTLPDLIASKFLSGKVPIIEEAIRFKPVGMQEGLVDVEILPGVWVGRDEDFIKRLIEERIKLKKQMKAARGEDRHQLDLKQRILKIIANTIYGISIEVNTTTAKDEPVMVHGLRQFETTVNKLETPGKAYNPIIAVFLTAGSRLILATAEALLARHGGYLVYCDTDSIFVQPKFVKLVQDFFRPLNPYDVPVEMFKVEEDDYGRPLDDVWFYGISAKRYVLYDRAENGYVIRKHSSHGLGGLVNFNEDSVRQLWKDILELDEHPDHKKEVLKKYRGKYAVGQLTVSGYEVLWRFIDLNHGKPYKEQIKPHNFITVGVGYQDSPGGGKIIPMLPYIAMDDPRFEAIPYTSFTDYKTGKRYDNKTLNKGEMWTKSYWQPLAEVVTDYIDHVEAKSICDEHTRGRLERRHVVVDEYSIRYIGKETNRLDEKQVTGVDTSDYVEYIDWKSYDG
jgi:hypothetical protein